MKRIVLSPGFLLLAALLLAHSGSAQTAGTSSSQKAAKRAQDKAKLPKLPKLPIIEERPTQKPGSSVPASTVPDKQKLDKQGKAKSKLDRIAEIVRRAREKEREQGTSSRHPALRNPFVGTWAVTRIVRNRKIGQGGRGWMIFTPSFVSMHLFFSGPGPNTEPKWQSSMRRWFLQGSRFMTASLMGIQNSDDGETIVLEQAGRREVRRFQFLAADLLRIYQGNLRYIELKRIERF